MDSATVLLLLAIASAIQFLFGLLARMNGGKNAFRSYLAGILLLTSGILAAGYQNTLLPWVSAGVGPLAVISGSCFLSLAVTGLCGIQERKFQKRLGFGAGSAYLITTLLALLRPAWLWIITAFASAPFFLIAGIYLFEEQNRSTLKTVVGCFHSFIAAIVVLGGGLKAAGLAVSFLQQENILLFLFILEQLTSLGYLFLFNEAAGFRLAQLSTHDELTGLYNSKGFAEAISKNLAMCGRHNIPYSLFIFDIDHFRKINDELGHVTGNLVLKDFAHRLSSKIRVYDILCRTHGDEFMLFLQSVDREKIEPVINRLCDGFGFQTHEGLLYTVSASAVTVDHPSGRAVTFEDLLAAGSQSLLAAKKNGGRRLEIAPF